jgi:hypothetical protein
MVGKRATRLKVFDTLTKSARNAAPSSDGRMDAVLTPAYSPFRYLDGGYFDNLVGMLA